jgi:hypothetical protein
MFLGEARFGVPWRDAVVSTTQISNCNSTERTLGGRMSKPHKWGLIGAGVGFCVGLLVVAFAYYANSHFPQQDFSIPPFILAPASLLAPPMSVILTMTTPALQWLLVLIFAASNAFFYGFGFSLVGKIRSRRSIA